MAKFRTNFTAIDGTQSTGSVVVLVEDFGRGSGLAGVISAAELKYTSGDGDQWRIRYFMGTTATPKAEFLTYVDLPTTAATYGDGADEDSSAPETAYPFDMTYHQFPAGWTDSDTPIAGLGLYATAEQLSNTGVTADAFTLRTVTKRR